MASPLASQPPAAECRLRVMGPADVPFVVREHRRHFPDGFFARLGPGFLGEYYRAFLSGPAAHTFVAEVDGRPVGYLVGMTDPAGHRAHVVRAHGRALVLRAAVAMLRRPSLAAVFVRTRADLYARKLLRTPATRPVPVSSDGPTAEAGAATAVLTHLAVVPAGQSRGVGSALVARFDACAAAAGCGRLALVTASGTGGAGGFYLRHGWQARGERRTPDGAWLTTYERPVRHRVGGVTRSTSPATAG